MRNRILKIAQAVIGGLGLIASGSASAQLAAANGYTAAGTDIDNVATVNYDLGGVAQQLIESDPDGNATPGAGNGVVTRFDVDRIIDLDVFTDDVVEVTPGEDGLAAFDAGNLRTALTFQVINLGNDTQDFALEILNRVAPLNEDVDGGGNEGEDTFDPTAFRIYRENGTTAGFSTDDDLVTHVDELGPDEIATLYVISTIPLDEGGTPLVSGDVAYVNLAAEARLSTGDATLGGVLTNADETVTETDDGSGAGTNYAGGTTTNIETVFGDTQDLNSVGNPDLVTGGGGDQDEDARAADTAAYVIRQLLTVTKLAEVVRDPFNGDVNPKRIPGAVIRYTITVVNNSTTTTAENVAITDDIPASTTYTADGVNNGVAADDPEGEIDTTPTATTVTVTFNAGTNEVNSAATNLGPGRTLTVEFSVTID